jgi:hypothetical protein
LAGKFASLKFKSQNAKCKSVSKNSKVYKIMEKQIDEKDLNISGEQTPEISAFENARGMLSHHISHFLVKARHGRDYTYSLEKCKETVQILKENTTEADLILKLDELLAGLEKVDLTASVGNVLLDKIQQSKNEVLGLIHQKEKDNE